MKIQHCLPVGSGVPVGFVVLVLLDPLADHSG